LKRATPQSHSNVKVKSESSFTRRHILRPIKQRKLTCSQVARSRGKRTKPAEPWGLNAIPLYIVDGVVLRDGGLGCPCETHHRSVTEMPQAVQTGKVFIVDSSPLVSCQEKLKVARRTQMYLL
jgi:hypothetical protein